MKLTTKALRVNLHGRLRFTFYHFGEIDCVFSPFKDAEIDLTVLRVENEVAQEDFDKKQKERGQQKPITPQSPAYQSPLVRRDNEDDDW